MTYLLDANIFIQSYRQIYPMDVMPSFWNKLSALAHDQYIVRIDKVWQELRDNEDLLSEWISDESNLPELFFRRTEDAINHYSNLMQWAGSPSNQYNENAKRIFMDISRADAWLIAYCLYISPEPVTLVTHEVSAPHSISSIKLPDACRAYNIPCCNLIEMLRNLSITI